MQWYFFYRVVRNRNKIKPSLGIEIYRFEPIQTRLCWGTLRLEHRSPCAGVSDLLLNNCILIAVTIAALSPRYLRRFGPKMLIKFLAAFRFRSWFPSVNQRGTTHRIAVISVYENVLIFVYCIYRPYMFRVLFHLFILWFSPRPWNWMRS